MRHRNQRRKNSRDLKSRPHLDSTFRTKRARIRVAHHKHTGRRLPFYCTSYAALFFILIFTSTLVLLISNSAKADQQSSSIQLSGLVKGPPPEIPAKIISPKDGSHFTKSQVEVEGTCLADTYVEIYRKDIFAGMTICSENGDFKIVITLVPGENLLAAKTRDSFGQYGPDSGIIKVYLDAKLTVTTTSSSGNSEKSTPATSGYAKPLLIYTDPVQRGLIMGSKLIIDYEVDGDEPPYTIAIDWGDGSPTTLQKHDKEGNFSLTHIYETSGQRTIRISGLGSKGGRASIQTIVVVHPAGAAVAASIGSGSGDNCDGTPGSASNFYEYCTPSNSALVKITEMLWPAIIVASLMTVSFWVGEKLMIHQLRLRS